nr:MAG TPA: hypothetical protein [Caudoviricetes sp.]
MHYSIFYFSNKSSTFTSRAIAIFPSKKHLV